MAAGGEPWVLDGADIPGFPDRPMVLAEVREWLLGPSGVPDEARRRVWSLLLARVQAEGGGAWMVAAAGMALPLLCSVASGLTLGLQGDPTDVHAEVLQGFLAELLILDPGCDRPIGRLRWAAYTAGRTALAAQVGSPRPAGEACAVGEPVRPDGHPDLVLVRSVAAGVLTAEEADLIGATRLEGISLRDYAASGGVGYVALRQRRLRAERRLIAYLVGPDGPDAYHPDPDPAPAVVAAGRTRWSPRRLQTDTATVTDGDGATVGRVAAMVSPNAEIAALPECGDTAEATGRSEVPRCA
jgi:hypothetical protein